MLRLHTVDWSVQTIRNGMKAKLTHLKGKAIADAKDKAKYELLH